MAQAWELTKREREVCRLLAEGRAPQEIAGELAIKPGSVYRHLVTIREKLECDHLVALVAKVCQGLEGTHWVPLEAARWPSPRRRSGERQRPAANAGQIALFSLE